MLYKNYTTKISSNQEKEERNLEKLLGLQDVIISNIEETNTEVHIYCYLQRKKHKCPHCGQITDKIHDYRKQTIKDISCFGKKTFIHLKKRRYRCSCGKRFYEENDFLPRYYRITKRLFQYVIEQLRKEYSYTSVGKETNLSTSTIIRYFDVVSYPKPKLPEVFSIDEFKGNTGAEKYQCIITDPVNKKVLDILPKRYSYYLTDYFNSYSKEERSKVKYFVSDMWKTYADNAEIWLNNAVQIVDKYHWIRQAIWAFEAVRKQEQKKFDKSYRKYFKHSRKLLLKRFDSLTDEQKEQVNVMLYSSPNISTAHTYKELFLKVLDSKDRDSAKESLSKWINMALDCSIPQLQNCAKTYINWLSGILNSFSTTITNGFTEGCNNKIKVLKRNAYGYRNFNRFRNRILHIFSN